MILALYSVQDSKSGLFFTPYAAPNAGVALRMFTDAIKNPNSEIAKHPEDYALYEIGTMDNQTSKLEACIPPKMLGTANQYLIN